MDRKVVVRMPDSHPEAENTISLPIFSLLEYLLGISFGIKSRSSHPRSDVGSIIVVTLLP